MNLDSSVLDVLLQVREVAEPAKERSTGRGRGLDPHCRALAPDSEILREVE